MKRFWNGKSVEGMVGAWLMGFLITVVLIYYQTGQVAMWQSIKAGLIASISEVVSGSISIRGIKRTITVDDNLGLPILSTLILNVFGPFNQMY